MLYSVNTGPEVGIHSGWTASPAQGRRKTTLTWGERANLHETWAQGRSWKPRDVRQLPAKNILKMYNIAMQRICLVSACLHLIDLDIYSAATRTEMPSYTLFFNMHLIRHPENFRVCDQFRGSEGLFSFFIAIAIHLASISPDFLPNLVICQVPSTSQLSLWGR